MTRLRDSFSGTFCSERWKNSGTFGYILSGTFVRVHSAPGVGSVRVYSVPVMSLGYEILGFPVGWGYLQGSF